MESLKALSRFDDALEEVIRVLGEAAIQVKEAGYEVRDYAESMEFDPRLLDRLQSRMDVIDKLRRKYGATIEDILAYYDKCQQELADIAEKKKDALNTFAQLIRNCCTFIA